MQNTNKPLSARENDIRELFKDELYLPDNIKTTNEMLCFVEGLANSGDKTEYVFNAKKEQFKLLKEQSESLNGPVAYLNAVKNDDKMNILSLMVFGITVHILSEQ